MPLDVSIKLAWSLASSCSVLKPNPDPPLLHVAVAVALYCREAAGQTLRCLTWARQSTASLASGNAVLPRLLTPPPQLMRAVRKHARKQARADQRPPHRQHQSQRLPTTAAPSCDHRCISKPLPLLPASSKRASCRRMEPQSKACAWRHACSRKALSTRWSVRR